MRCMLCKGTYMFISECIALSEFHTSVSEYVLLNDLINLCLVQLFLVARYDVI